ncbi:TonB-dependent receptor [Pseudomonas fluorescens]|uniref:TonB-dependent receptor n=1 Tax=Pseudomonas fluorescens TaxID=294 RepID=UPI001783DB73|nr:TonB-dependent receptor [Pseudomonas fluorescens]MBD8151055.1 TonB-dependent receptor [Pseudomonas fluorescens]MBD8179642.1 TonB-dependent receptor [Pseudomonas fluorescens]MBD8744758.1 TonB-dependent receptor [Pseudomonas fluorescens]MBD8748544.1 TonB-dependent receptor [Pseudomonas fluorescens]MBD8762442.1 TonB-dependent receptor [Pseudomonas fluorescens]
MPGPGYRLLWLGCLAALPWAPANAGQEAPGPLTLDESTVTARRREEALQDVPIPISVLYGDQLDEAGLHRLQDIQQRVPGLVVSGHDARFAGFGLRGFGATAYNDGLEGSVGTYVDGVYQARQGMAFTELMDIERIEVLRGPQGTLFGKNTSAGALSIITRPPTFAPEANLEVSQGEHGLREYRGVISGALQDDVLAGRLNVFNSAVDGAVRNLQNGSRLGAADSQGLRGQLLWTPSADFSARLIADHAEQNDAGNVLLANHYSAQTRQRAKFLGYPLAEPSPYRRETRIDAPGRPQTVQNGVSLELNRDVNEAMRLTSITAYRDWDYRATRDGDSTALAVAQSATALSHRQFSQEWRLSGSAGPAIDYVAGLYYLRQQLGRRIDVAFGKDAAPWFVGDQLASLKKNYGITFTAPDQVPAILLEGARQRYDGEQKSENRALFGQVSWRPIDRLELTGGLRYSQERKNGWVSRDVSNLAPLNGLPQAFQAGGQLLRGIALGGDYYRDDSIEENSLSSLLSASYRFNDAVMGYASLSRGYKAGGINFDVVGPFTAPTFAPERATSLELGVKTRFWEDRAMLDLAVYQTDVDNYQALTYSPPTSLFAPPLRDNLINVGKVRLRGIELDSAWQLAAPLTARLGLAWSDARYRSFPNAPCPPASGQWNCDLSGERLYNAPQWSFSGGLDYIHPLAYGLQAYSGLDYSFRTGYYGTLEGGEGSYQPSYGLTNLRLGLRSQDRAWEVEGWVRNVFDRHYITAVYSLLGAGDYGVMTGSERTLGTTVRLRY